MSFISTRSKPSTWRSEGIAATTRISALERLCNGRDALFDVFTVTGLTGGQNAAISAFLQEQVGSHYDWLGISRFLSGINRDNYQYWFCSELVAEACEEAGIPLLQAEAWKISPTTLSWSPLIRPAYRAVGIEWWSEFFNLPAAAAYQTHDPVWWGNESILLA